MRKNTKKIFKSGREIFETYIEGFHASTEIDDLEPTSRVLGRQAARSLLDKLNTRLSSMQLNRQRSNRKR